MPALVKVDPVQRTIAMLLGITDAVALPFALPTRALVLRIVTILVAATPLDEPSSGLFLSNAVTETTAIPSEEPTRPR